MVIQNLKKFNGIFLNRMAAILKSISILWCLNTIINIPYITTHQINIQLATR